MLKIPGELLNLLLVEAGRIELNLRMVNPAEIIEIGIYIVATAAKEKKIAFRSKEFGEAQKGKIWVESEIDATK